MSADTVFVPLWVDLSAVAVSAVQGALFAGRDSGRGRIDLLGVVFIGIATGLGGGLIRDLLLSRVPKALETNAYLSTAIIAALIGMLFARPVRRLTPLLVIIDAASLGLYLIVGITTATGAGLGTVPTMFVAVLASTGGGLIRDLLSGAPVALVQGGTFYVTAAVGGALVYQGLTLFTKVGTAAGFALAATFLLRMLSLAFGWNSPAPHTLPVDIPTRHRPRDTAPDADGGPRG